MQLRRAAPLVLALGVSACGAPTEPAAVATSPPATPTLSAEQARTLLADSWMARAGADDGALAALLDASGGDGWIALFHGDLRGADREFGVVPASDSARLGKARVHLERAAAYDAAAALCREAGIALFDWRDEHRETVRTGPLEPLLAAFLRGQDPPPGDDHSAIRALFAGDSSQLPDPWRARRAFVNGSGDAADAAAAQTAAPDVVDVLGRDDEAGVTFELPFDDPARLGALVRAELAAAVALAEPLGAAGGPIVAAASAFGGLDAPPTGDGGSIPAWLALFGAPQPDLDAWLHRWSRGAAGRSFGDRLPLDGWGQGTGSDDVDRILRMAAGLGTPLLAGLADEPGLAAELELPQLLVDGLLREQMNRVLGASPAQARRLGERSLDATPGSLGGSPDGGRAGVSHRNDRAFLLSLARVYWKAGQPDDAVRLVHPLTSDLPPLASVERPLAQLGAASTVGQRGETNQL